MITREPTPVTGPLSALAYAFGEIGRAGILAFQSILLLPVTLFGWRSRRELVSQMYQAGIKSLPIISVVALFTGMILALQVGLELRRYNQEIYIGSAVMVSLLREMGPFMTGIVLTACVGSSMAAQLGTMTVNEEIAALEMMAINPVRFLMAPRMGAMLFMTPLLSFYTCILGVIGGGVVGFTQLSVPWRQYIKTAIDFAGARDLYVGLLKALVFAIIITTVACYEGFTTTRGAVGVGQATRRSVISSLLLILMTGYIITRMFYDL
ncbi:MAG: ABC transporter permease [Kiritimatiellae bacterium]|jgi:phospholipid/cholesterol/gamma-HCH transport system permease protein|nr:ABC transporter permease [Kiritimatiellia bacterium]